jgi:hypothetical protein
MFIPALDLEPPSEDVRYFDARHLIVHQEADDLVRSGVSRIHVILRDEDLLLRHYFP